jgi:hypothetical protein
MTQTTNDINAIASNPVVGNVGEVCLKAENEKDINEDLNATTIQTYVYLIRTGKPVGPRDVMRGANLTSPSVAYRNLQKLIDIGLVLKDEYGDYVVKEKVGFKGQVWIGKSLIPRVLIFGFVFLGILIGEVAILIPHLFIPNGVQESFWFLAIVTAVAAAIFLIEGLRPRKKNAA